MDNKGLLFDKEYVDLYEALIQRLTSQKGQSTEIFKRLSYPFIPFLEKEMSIAIVGQET